jgi:PAS domain-containing protein
LVTTTKAGQSPRDDGEGGSGSGKDRVLGGTAATPVHPGVIRSFGVISRGASFLVTLTGALGLLGWVLDVAVLRSVLPSLASMKVNTGVAFMLVGTAAWLLSEGNATPLRIRTRRALAVAALAIGLVTLLEYLFGWKVGIDELLLRPAWGTTLGLFPSRMAPATAGSFVFIGLALLLIDARIAHSEQRPAEWLALLVGAISLLALLGYLYGARSLYAMGLFSSMALPTAFTFSACSTAILLARPERGLARIIASATPGGFVSRRMLPVAVVIPIVMGWLRLKGQQLGFYGTEFGLALFASSNVFCFAAFTAWTARVLVASDAARWQTEETLREKEEHLEITLRSIGDGVISTDSDGRVVQVNSAAERMTGWSSSEAQGKALGDIFQIVNEEHDAVCHQQRHLAAWRYRKKPVRLVLQIDVPSIERHTFLLQHDGGEMDEGAEQVADELEFHGFSPWFERAAQPTRSIAMPSPKTKMAAVSGDAR